MFQPVKALQRTRTHLGRRHFIGLSVAALSTAPFFRMALANAKTPFSQRFEQIKKTATKEQLYAFLFDLPKGGDIHNHWDGSNFPEWWFDVATNTNLNGGNEFYTRLDLDNCEGCGRPLQYLNLRKSAYQELPECCQAQYKPLASLTSEEKQRWFSSLKLDQPGEGREEFFGSIFSRLGQFAETPELMAELVVENMKQLGAEGVRYMETIVTPFDSRDRDGNPIAPEVVDSIYRQRLSQPDALATGVTIRFQIFILRFLPDAEQQIERAYAFIVQHRDLWVGVNLVGDEADENGKPLRFLETFKKLRQTYSGVELSIHAGEAVEPNDNVRNTLLLGATRIGHGVNLIADPETMQVMRDNEYLVEIQLISNLLLQYTPDLAKHPFPEYLRFGIPVCLNTDDRGIFDSNITDEYYTAVTQFDLSWDDLVVLGQNSLKYAFLEPAIKRKLLKDYAYRISRFARKYADDSWSRTLAEVKPITSGYSRKAFGIDV